MILNLNLDDLCTLFGSILSAFSGAAVSLFYMIGSGIIGYIILRKCNLQNSKASLHLAYGLGASIQGICITIFSLLGLSYSWILGAIGVFPYIFWLIMRRQLDFGRLLPNRPQLSLESTTWFKAIIWICIGCFWLYAAAFCFSYYRGADLGIYHLIIPRDIVWHHGFVPNAFAYFAGGSAGWHHYGAFAYLVGKEPAYLGLSFWCFIALCFLIKDMTRLIFPFASPLTPLLTVFAAVLIIVGMMQGSISNNDLPMLYLEFILAITILQFSQLENRRNISYIVGIIAGFILAIKVTSMVGVALLIFLFLYSSRKDLFATILRVGIPTILIGGTWPLISLIYFGSPLPQCLASLRIFGQTLPQLREAAAATELVHGNWLISNIHRYFNGNMIPLLILLMGIFFLPLGKWDQKKVVKLLWVIGGFAILRFFGIYLMSPRLDILLHERYHLITYIILAGLGIVGWEILVRRLLFARSNFHQVAITAFVIGLFSITTCVPFKMFFPDAHDPEPTVVEIPNMFGQIGERLASLWKAAPWKSQPIIEYIRTKSASNAVIGTILMAPYEYDRPYLQLLPAAQTRLDLTLPPEKLLAELQQLGISYLHLTYYPGLAPGLAPMMEKWLRSLRQIQQLSGVELVLEIEETPGRYNQLFKIKSANSEVS